MNLQFVSRSDWGAKYAAGFGARPLPLSEAWLHHSVTLAPDLAFTDLNADSVDDDEAAAMRQVEAIGQQRFGAGFSYNIAGMPSGRLYVGCGVRRVGAHTRGRNTKALGVVLIGDYSTRQVPQPLLDSLVQLLQFAKQEDWLLAPRFNGGHRDAPGASTECPGKRAYAQIPLLNQRAALPFTPSPSAPVITPPAPEPVIPGGPDMVIILEPKNYRAFLCDRDGASHIGLPERDLLLAANVPYLGTDMPSEARREALARRGVTDL